ncbi:hypothetical protein Fmac_005774 [Flemingia macrophylla]|uniref:Uncharacterized protein n=1 Tax=Flemingia macrophylla TaxID=520843 RepID=A0ABD1N8V8_9FABA
MCVVVDAESAFHASVVHFAESASPPVLLHSRTSLADTATWSSATSTTRTPRCDSCWDSRCQLHDDVGLQDPVAGPHCQEHGGAGNDGELPERG